VGMWDFPAPEFKKFTLENGLTVVVERHTRVRSVSIGAWVRIGSRFESVREAGLSHFVEHMLFKGTERRSPIQIATALERLGGDLNAFTDKEYTCFHATVLAEHLETALDVLSDLVIHPLFPRAELEREKKILLHELSLVEDAPDDWILDLFLQTIWKDDPLGLPVIGNRANIMATTRARMVTYFKKHYRPDNMVLSVSGNVEFDHVRELAERMFQFGPVQKVMPSEMARPVYQSKRRHLAAATDQTHLLLGFEGVGFRDPGRFDLLILSFFLGGGMSSRLFQEIREKAALAYTVDCDCISFSDTGIFDVYLNTSPRSLTKCLDILSRELNRLAEKPLTEEDLETVKSQLKGAVLLASDEMESRQESIGRNELVFGRYLPVEEIVKDILKVTPDSVQKMAASTFTARKESVLTLGKIKPKGNVSVFR
jgi:predicted Zn-dependent peptidase